MLPCSHSVAFGLAYPRLKRLIPKERHKKGLGFGVTDEKFHVSAPLELLFVSLRAKPVNHRIEGGRNFLWHSDLALGSGSGRPSFDFRLH